MPQGFDVGSLASQGEGELLGKAQSAISLINFIKATKNAKALAKSRPKYKISPYAQDDLSLAESELSGGMSGRAETAYTQGADKDFSSSLEAILRGGGSVNNVGDLFGRSESGRMRLSVLQDNLRLKQIDNLVRSRRYMDEQKDKVFQINEYAPWKDKQMANSKAREDAAAGVWAGLETSGSAEMNAMSNAGGYPEDKYTYDNYRNFRTSDMVNPSFPNTNDTGERPVPRNKNMFDYNYDFLDDPNWWNKD